MFFTSESVTEGHPDKLCHQVSDAVLDACLTQDPESQVASETYVTRGVMIVGGKITTRANNSAPETREPRSATPAATPRS